MGRFSFLERGAVVAKTPAVHEAAESASLASKAARAATMAGQGAASMAGGWGGRLAQAGLAAGAAGAAIAEMDEIMRFVRFIGDFVEDPKGAFSRLLGIEDKDAGQTAQERQAAVFAGVKGAPAPSREALQGLSVSVYKPGEREPRQVDAAGARTLEEAYARAAKGGLKGGDVVAMSFEGEGGRVFANAEAVDAGRFRYLDGEAGRAQFIRPRGFDDPGYAAAAGKRLALASDAVSVEAGSLKANGSFVTVAPVAVAAGPAFEGAARTIGLAGARIGSGARHGAAGDGLVSIGSDGAKDGERFVSARAGDAGLSLVEKDGVVSIAAMANVAGVRRSVVVSGDRSEFGSLGQGRAASLTPKGEAALAQASGAAVRAPEGLLEATEGLGGERSSMRIADRRSGRDAEIVVAGNRMVVASQGRLDLLEKGRDGQVSARRIEDPGIVIGADGAMKLPRGAAQSIEAFGRQGARDGVAFSAEEVRRAGVTSRGNDLSIGD